MPIFGSITSKLCVHGNWTRDCSIRCQRVQILSGLQVVSERQARSRGIMQKTEAKKSRRRAQAALFHVTPCDAA